MPRETVYEVKADVDKFCEKAPQFDDITMIAVKYINLKTD